MSGVGAEPGRVGFGGPQQNLELILNQWEIMSGVKTGESGSLSLKLRPRTCPLISEGGEGKEKEGVRH